MPIARCHEPVCLALLLLNCQYFAFKIQHFIVREGQKRPLRRMCEAVGLTVKGVLRTRIGHLRLDKLAPGQWRFLRPDESL